MFALVNDIEAYPQYMDGCYEASVLARGENWLEARLTLGMAGQKQSFVTRNQLFPPHRMTMGLVDGPFKTFNGDWRFTALGDQGCKVSLSLDFSLSNPLLGMMVNKMFEKIASAQVDALCLRARQIYGDGE